MIETKIIIFNSLEYKDALKIRKEVFVFEQKILEEQVLAKILC